MEVKSVVSTIARRQSNICFLSSQCEKYLEDYHHSYRITLSSIYNPYVRELVSKIYLQQRKNILVGQSSYVGLCGVLVMMWFLKMSNLFPLGKLLSGECTGCGSELCCNVIGQMGSFV